MSLVDERGRGELNVKGDKGIKEHIQHVTECQSFKKNEHTLHQLIQSFCL